MGYKGAISAGTTVRIVLTLDDAEGPAALLAAFAPWDGGDSDEAGAVVGPGLTDEVEVSVPEKGLLSIVVDMSDDVADPGTLHVFVDGAPRTTDPVSIEGDTKWTYSVEAR